MFTELIFINNGNRTKWSSIQSVSIPVINKIGRTILQIIHKTYPVDNIDMKKILRCGYSLVIFQDKWLLLWLL